MSTYQVQLNLSHNRHFTSRQSNPKFDDSYIMTHNLGQNNNFIFLNWVGHAKNNLNIRKKVNF